MAILVTKDTPIQTQIAPWMARELGSSAHVRGSFETLAKLIGPHIEPPRPWPFANVRYDHTDDPDFRIKLNGQNRRLWVVVKLVDDDGEVMQHALPIALRRYWEKHFKGAAK